MKENELKEDECHFTSMENIWCKECKEKKLHETGIVKGKPDEKVKECISCYLISRR